MYLEDIEAMAQELLSENGEEKTAEKSEPNPQTYKGHAGRGATWGAASGGAKGAAIGAGVHGAVRAARKIADHLPESKMDESARFAHKVLKRLPSKRMAVGTALVGAGVGAAKGALQGVKQRYIAGPKDFKKTKKSSIDPELLAQEYLEKTAETERERAHRWGTSGAIGGTALGGVNVIRGRHLLREMARHGGTPGAVGTALGAAMGVGTLGAVGYGAGRLAHRVVKGPATDAKVKTKKSSVDFDLLAEDYFSRFEKDAGIKDMGSKVMGAIKRGGQGAMGMAKRYGELMKGGKKGEYGELAGKRAGNSRKGFKQWKSEARKSLGARVGTAAAVAGGGYAAKKKLEK